MFRYQRGVGNRPRFLNQIEYGFIVRQPEQKKLDDAVDDSVYALQPK
jgi:hypothetical protein